MQDGRSLLPNLPLDAVAAEQAVSIFNKFCLPDVIGTPSLEEAGAEWFRDWVRAIFGSLDRNGRRRVKRIFGLVPKKNAKTTYSAALMLTGLLLNKRPRADFINVAPTKLLAEIAYEKAVGMIESDPEGFLKKRFYPRDHKKEIEDLANGSTWKLRAFELNVTNGIIPAGLLVDEEHLIAQDPNAYRVLGQLFGGMLPIPEAFGVIISTQSDVAPVGKFKTDLERARAIRDGEIEGDMLPFLYEMPLAMQEKEEVWLDRRFWPCVLPNLDRSVTIDSLINDPNGLRDAQFAGHHEVLRWASQHLNIQIGSKQAADGWSGAEFWDRQADDTITFKTILSRCDIVTVGVDGGGLDDLLGFAVVGIDRDTGQWLAWVHGYVHAIVFERRKSIASELRDFEAAGELTVVSSMSEAFKELAKKVAEIDAAGCFGKAGFDPVGVKEIVTALASCGIEGDELITGVPQGYKLSGTIKSTEGKLSDDKLRHADQAIMRWCVGNARVELRGNATIITKQASGTAKIDLLMALLDAIAAMLDNPKPRERLTRDALILV